MARFPRMYPAPLLRGKYTVFKSHVREDFKRCCAYCLMPEIHASGKEGFQLDHFRPQAKFPELIRDFHNLYWCCYVCNMPSSKGKNWPSPVEEEQGIGFVDFCRDDFDDHYELMPDGLWRPKTKSGKYTIETIGLNRDHLVRLRLKIRWQP